jgi:ubiquinone/menaquinone biosynthesis C-methylase UbiE
MHRKKLDFKFGKRASVYDESYEGKFSRRFYKLLLDNVDLKPKSKILDVGCGTGEILKRLSHQENILGYGIDVEENMVGIAKRKCPDMKIQISKSDYLPFTNESFDIIIACMAYHHFENRIGFAREAARVLKKGGKLYVVDPNFPAILRKVFNKILRHINTTGHFSDSNEICTDFASFGFGLSACIKNGYAQLFILEKM